jgi:hemerythrin-like domain-containing protein
MCEYCGCRGIAPIAALMDEHLEMEEIAGRLRRAIAEGDEELAVDELRQLIALLGPHVRQEEDGILAALRREPEFAGHVAELEREHDEMQVALAALLHADRGWTDRVPQLLAELLRHIDKEDDGTFPVAAVTLGADGWALVEKAQARRAAEKLVVRSEY